MVGLRVREASLASRTSVRLPNNNQPRRTAISDCSARARLREFFSVSPMLLLVTVARCAVDRQAETRREPRRGERLAGPEGPTNARTPG
jgi:hypothetical protein